MLLNFLIRCINLKFSFLINEQQNIIKSIDLKMRKQIINHEYQ